jgi:hypothetical protein
MYYIIIIIIQMRKLLRILLENHKYKKKINLLFIIYQKN